MRSRGDLGRHERLSIYPAKHFVVEEATLEEALGEIRKDLGLQLSELRKAGGSAGGALTLAHRVRPRNAGRGWLLLGVKIIPAISLDANPANVPIVYMTFSRRIF